MSNGFAAQYGELVLPFERCQLPDTFVARAPGFNLLVSREEAWFALAGKPGAMVGMRLVGAARDARVNGEAKLLSHSNYITGNKPSDWRINVSQYGSVRVQESLPYVDLVYYGSPGTLEYDLVLRPGADLRMVRLQFEGAVPSLDREGNLVLKTDAGDVVQHRPEIKQGERKIPGRFAILANGDVGFQVGRYDRTRELRIDPVITYSTYLGGTSGGSPNAVAVDAAGNAYIAGATASFNFPVTPGAVQTSFPSTTQTVAFVAKLNPAGTGIVYTTFLGGSGVNGGDAANAIFVDSTGAAYVAGTTGSTNFPVTQGALSSTLHGATDAFVAKINPAGSALVYGTYLGGSGLDTAAGIAVDTAGNAYVTGSTSSTNFPLTSGAPQSILKSANDAFVVKLNPTGASLVYSTYLGGSAEDDGHAIAIDSAGNAYVAGTTASTDFPVTSGVFQTRIGPAPVAFAAKVNAAGTALSFSTYLGGTGGDKGNAVAVDSSGDTYVAGTTFSADFPTTSGVFSYTAPGSAAYGHAFLTKLTPAGTGLIYSTYLGGSNSDGANGLAIDTFGNATLAGFTNSANFPVTANPAETVTNFNPAGFLATMNQSGTALVYSTMLGATGSTVAQAVTLDATNHAYVVGYTGSLTLPGTPGSFQSSNGTATPQANTGFAMKLDLGSAVACALSFSPGTASFPLAGGAITVSVVAPTGCAWEAVPGNSWVTVNPVSSGVGGGAITFTAASNSMSLASRSTLVKAGSAALTVTQVAGSCSSPQFYPITQAFSPTGGTGSIAVSVPSSCAVTAVSGASWITVNSGASATGSDLVLYTVAADTGAGRAGTITIAGTAYTISQTGSSCGASLTPSTLNFGPAGGTFTVSLAASSGCSWTAISTVGWVTVTPASGTGNGTLTLTTAANLTPSVTTTVVTVAGLSLTVTQTAAAPTADSVTPSTGTGSSQVFTAVYSDSTGARSLNNELLLINSSLSAASGCYFEVGPSGIYLYDDDAAPVLLGPLGSGGTFSNQQCTVNSSGSGISQSGNSLTLTLAITFKNSFAGLKNIYMYAGDVSGSISGWQTRGTFTVLSGAPTADSVTPSTGTGLSQVFAAVYSDPKGTSALTSELFLINSSLSAASGCYFEVSPSGIYLYDDDALPTLLGPLGTGGTLSNKQCTVNGAGSGISRSGNSLTLTLSITFNTSFAGSKNIYMYAGDASGYISSWQTKGTFTVPSSAPTADSLAPSTGSGLSQVFTAVYSDPKGAGTLNNELLLINSSLSAASGCYFEVSPSGIYLYDDDAAPILLGPLGTGGMLSNKQCTVNGAGSGITHSGNSLTLTLSISFNTSFAGAKNIYMYAGDVSGSTSGWQTRGTFTIGSAAPTADSVTPNTGTGLSQVFLAVYTDPKGASNLNSELLLINSSLSAASGCYFEVGLSGIYLYDDDVTPVLLGPLGVSGALSNHQCTVNGAGSGVSYSVNSLTLTLSISFNTSFAGSKNIYMYASDGSGSTSGWQTRGVFTVP